MTVTHPLLLIDQPEDGYMETLGWIEATVSEDEARDRLTEFCCDADGEMGFRPTGPAERKWLKPQIELGSEEYLTALNEGYSVMWDAADPQSDGAVEFWEVVAA